MGAVDLVIQVESPPSVASGLQRVGRAGHQVGAVSRGVIFPKYRGDLVQTAVVAERMRDGAIEALRYPRNPLDVLAQQVVAMVAVDEWDVEDMFDVVRRAAPYGALPRSAFEAVLDMLAGRYPTDEFAELRPRLVWDRVAGTLTGRPGAQRLAVTSGGTIPDRGLFGVFLVGETKQSRRVGELDEEMVYESRVGDVFTLGSTSWRIEDITHDRVLVTPAPGQPGRLPFWKGDALGPAGRAGPGAGRVHPRARRRCHRRRPASGCWPAGSTTWAADNLLAYLAEQREATGHLPDDRTDRGRALPRRARRLAGRDPLALRRARCTRRGRWRVGAGCASATASTCRRCTPTTASCCGCPTSSSRTAARPRRSSVAVVASPTTSSRW